MSDVRTIRVFIASPSDLAVERRAFQDVLEELNDGFGNGAGVKFEASTWEQTLAMMSQRSQGLINHAIDQCDVFVLALYGRWGQAAPDAKPYSSYTEEEFHRALDRWKKTSSPKIFVFFKHVTPRELGDPGEQLKKILTFRQSLEDLRQVLYRFFADEKEFKTEVNQHLRAYAKGELPPADAARDAVLLPQNFIEEIKKAKEEAEARVNELQKKLDVAEQRTDLQQKLNGVFADKSALERMEHAIHLAKDGKVEAARQSIAGILKESTSWPIEQVAFSFFTTAGDLGAREDQIPEFLSGPTERTKRIVWVLERAKRAEKGTLPIRLMSALSSFAVTKVDAWSRPNKREYTSYLIQERDLLTQLFNERGAPLRVLLNWSIDEFCGWSENGRGNVISRLRQLRKFIEGVLENDELLARARFVHTTVRDRNLFFVGDRYLFEGRKLTDSEGFQATRVVTNAARIQEEIQTFDSILDYAVQSELERIPSKEQSEEAWEDELSLNEYLLGRLISKLNRDIARLGAIGAPRSM